jgi:hypothetical protein
MTFWNFFTIASILVILGLGIYNIRSLIRKAKVPGNKVYPKDLMIGIIIWLLAMGGLIYIAIKQFA